uniref:Mitochondrial ribosomal protein L1 n=1 Tax=Nothoprocta perdicaria TaxID=30464 RepID=A0A8C6ZIM9_NOTPE
QKASICYGEMGCANWEAREFRKLSSRNSSFPFSLSSVVPFLACWVFFHFRTAKKGSQKPKQEETKKRRRPRLPLLSKPVDDVYLTWRYKRPSYDVDVAVGMLKKFQQLDFTYPKQFVYINVTLDMSLPKKKKKVEQFSSLVRLPHRFTDETNKVLVFTEVNNGLSVIFVDLSFSLFQILEDEIKMDFYVAVPEIMPKLIPLKSKLRRKYPSARRNSMGQDIPKMLQFFKEGLEYAVQDEHLIKTRIARVSLCTKLSPFYGDETE